MEEIKIKVKQVNEGTAMKDAVKDAEKLRQEQTKSGPGATQGRAAQTAEESHNRKRVQAERDVTREKEKQSAVAKAHHHGNMGNARMVGEFLDMATGGQGFVMRAMQAQRMLEMFGGSGSGGIMGALKKGGLIAAAATAVDIGITATKFEQYKLDVAEQNEHRETASAQLRARSRAQREGNSGALAGTARDLKEQAAAGEEHLKTLQENAQNSLLGQIDSLFGTSIATKGLGWFKPASARAIEKQKADNEQNRAASEAAADTSRYVFQTEGMDRIHAMELRGQGKYTQANDAEDKAQWFKTYHETIAESGGDEDKDAWAGIEAANAENLLRKRERMNTLAHAVNGPRSGNTAIANLARLMAPGGAFDSAGGGGALHELKKVNVSLKDQLKVASDSWLTDFKSATNFRTKH
jgi:hypothetical protein